MKLGILLVLLAIIPQSLTTNTETTTDLPYYTPKPGELICRGNNYENYKEANGHCFFEPYGYRHRINQKQADGQYWFNMVEARKMCKRNNSTVLQWDVSKPGPETDAIRELRSQMHRDTPIDCLVLDDVKTLDCNASSDDAGRHVAFLNKQEQYIWPRVTYDEGTWQQYMAGLICDQIMPTGTR